MQRRPLLEGLLLGGVATLVGRRARAADTHGVTATEIKIGNTNALSGPASAYGVIARTEAAYFRMINDQGGIAGRRINFIYYDDAYSPPRAVEEVRKLVEEDEVAFLFNTLGTPSNTAIRPYLNQKKVPQLFVFSGADKWGDYQHFPWTVGYLPSYRTEAAIYGKYILSEKPDARIGVLYQNDDYGKDYFTGLKQRLGDKFDKLIAKVVTYETSDPTVDSQVVALQTAGADVFVNITTPKFAAMAIRKAGEIGWKPLHLLNNVSASVGSVLKPAGLDKSVGLITAAYVKDPTDKRWDDDPGMKAWRSFMDKYMPTADQTDGFTTAGYAAAFVMTHVLRQCGDDFSRENILKQATNIKGLEVPVFFPGIRVDTSPTNHQPIRQLQLTRFTGTYWEPFGGIIEGADV